MVTYRLIQTIGFLRAFGDHGRSVITVPAGSIVISLGEMVGPYAGGPGPDIFVHTIFQFEGHVIFRFETLEDLVKVHKFIDVLQTGETKT